MRVMLCPLYSSDTNVLEQMHWSHAKLMFADNCETNILENVTPREKVADVIF